MEKSDEVHQAVDAGDDKEARKAADDLVTETEDAAEDISEERGQQLIERAEAIRDEVHRLTGPP